MKDSNKKNYAVQICFISLFVFCGLLLGVRVKEVKATITYFQTIPTDGHQYTNTLTAGEWYDIGRVKISGIDVLASFNSQVGMTHKIRLCKGAFVNGTLYNASCSQQIDYCTFLVTSQGTQPTYYACNFNYTYVIDSPFYWLLEEQSHTALNVPMNRHDNMPTGTTTGRIVSASYKNWSENFVIYLYPTGQWQTSSRLKYDDSLVEIPPDFLYEGQNQYQPDKTLLTWRSDINTVYYQICYLNSICNLWINFNEQAINDKVYLVYDILYKQTPNFGIASTTIRASPIWQNKLNVPATSTEGIINYCLYLVDAEFGDLLNCGLKINWVSTTTFDEILGIASSTLSNICSNVATSTGGFDDFRYGVECGLRKLIFWAFSPDNYAINYFLDDYGLLKMSFPFNIFFTLTDTAKNAISTTTLSQNDNLGLPFIRKTATSSQFYILPVISSSSLANAIGQTNAGIFRTTLSYFIYIMTASIIFLIII